MADTKISAMGAAATLSLINTVPIVQSGVNKTATLGQIKALSNLPIIGITTGALISLSYELVSISGTCTLPVGTDGAKITLIATDVGTLTGTGISYTFSAGNTLSLVWLNAKWNVLSVNGMV